MSFGSVNYSKNYKSSDLKNFIFNKKYMIQKKFLKNFKITKKYQNFRFWMWVGYFVSC